jgi:hypothetical protein
MQFHGRGTDYANAMLNNFATSEINAMPFCFRIIVRSSHQFYLADADPPTFQRR